MWCLTLYFWITQSHFIQVGIGFGLITNYKNRYSQNIVFCKQRFLWPQIGPPYTITIFLVFSNTIPRIVDEDSPKFTWFMLYLHFGKPYTFSKKKTSCFFRTENTVLLNYLVLSLRRFKLSTYYYAWGTYLLEA